MGWTTKPPAGTPLKTGTWHTQNLKSFWSFQEGSGTTLNDLASSPYNMTLYNFADPPTGTSGWNTESTGPLLAFDGSNDYCNGSSNYTISDPLTIAFWIKFANVFWIRTIFHNTYSSYGIWVFSENSKIRAQVGVSGTAATSNTTLVVNTWYHSVVVYNSGTAYFYLNGVADGSGTVNTIPTGGSTAYIGIWSGTYQFNGRIDDVRIWTRALSSSEIAELYSDRWGIFQDPPRTFKSVAGVATENIKSIAGVGIDDIKNI